MKSPPSEFEASAPAVARARAGVKTRRNAARRACLVGVLVCVAIGMGLRMVQYLHVNSYWNDEAALVMNILHRGFGDLLKPLDFAQAAPPMFLWMERLVFVKYGASELVLRALPVLLGMIGLACFALLAWRLLRPVGALWAVAWFAMNDRIIPQACEVKQYSSDVLMSTLLFLAAFGGRKSISDLNRLARVAALASVGIWFSFPSAIVFGGIALALMPAVLRRPGGWRWFGACMALPLISTGLLARIVLSHPRDPYLNEFWSAHFADLHHPLRWLGRAFFALADYPFASVGAVVLMVAIAGAMALWRQGRGHFVGAVLWTLALAVVASAARVYPFDGSRVTLYLFPPLFLLMGAGAEPWGHRGGRWFVRVLVLVPAGLLAVAMLQCGSHAINPVSRSNIRPVVEYVRVHRAADETIYLAGGGALPQTRVSGRNVEFLCYWSGNEEGIYRRMIDPAQITEARFWVVYSLVSNEKRSHLEMLLRDLDGMADVQERFVAGPAGAVLYRRRAKAATQANGDAR